VRNSPGFALHGGGARRRETGGGSRQVGEDQHTGRKHEEVASGIEGARGWPAMVGCSLQRKKQPRAAPVLGARLWL
jgi:hypothetical protein